MRTSDVMSSPVVTVPPDARLKDVAATLVEHGINAVPVVDDDRLVGIVSEADLLTLEATPGVRHRPGSAARQGPPHTAREVMSHSVYTLTQDTDAAAAARMMLRHNLKSVPVVAGDRVVGIVARRDLLRLIARSDHDIRADLERRLKEELDALQRLVVDVTGGVVTIDAAVDPLGQQLLEGLARTVPGVVEVRTSQPATDGIESAETDRR
jgi:CBS domain-containing protein